MDSKFNHLDKLIFEALNESLLNERLPFSKEDFEKIYGKKVEKPKGLESGSPDSVRAEDAWELSQAGTNKSELDLNDIEWYENNPTSDKFDVQAQAHMVAIIQKYR